MALLARIKREGFWEEGQGYCVGHDANLPYPCPSATADGSIYALDDH